MLLPLLGIRPRRHPEKKQMHTNMSGKYKTNQKQSENNPSKYLCCYLWWGSVPGDIQKHYYSFEK